MCGCEPGFVCTRCAGTSADPWWWLDDSPRETEEQQRDQTLSTVEFLEPWGRTAQ